MTADMDPYFSTVEHLLSQGHTINELESVRKSLGRANKKFRKEFGMTPHPDALRGHDLYVRVLRRMGQGIRREQERGNMRTRSKTTFDKPSPKDFFQTGTERQFAYLLAAMSDEEFTVYMDALYKQKVFLLSKAMRMAGMKVATQGISKFEIIELAKQPGITRTQIAAKTGASMAWVNRILNQSGYSVPAGTYIPPKTVDPGLDTTRVVSATVEIIAGAVPMIDKVDLTKIDKEAAEAALKELGPIMGQLRRLSKALKEQV